MRTVVLLSGGLDSAVVLWLRRECDPLCLSFDYGQKHVREIESAKELAFRAGCEHEIVRIPKLRGSALTGDKAMPDKSGDASDTVVPNRNMIMIAVAANYAGNGGTVCIGSHTSDHIVYPDCRPEFLDSLSKSLALSCGVTLDAPFANQSRDAVAEIAKFLGVPVGLTWSCYAGGEVPCSTCPSCVGRNKIAWRFT
jgi:7-cyano-7-deazaguanine synthase